MTLLALEFSSSQRSVAVLRGGGVAVSTPAIISETVETGSSAAGPFSMIENALHEAQVEREQIECVAVGLGPGSYTGVRAAIAIAQGWQLARDIKLLGISSAEAIAARAHADGRRGQVAVVIDAQRNEFYLAEYELDEAAWREGSPLRLVSMGELQAIAEKGEPLIGPEVMRWFPDGQAVSPRAAAVGRLALLRTDFVSGEKLEPIYLRETKFVKAPPLRKI